MDFEQLLVSYFNDDTNSKVKEACLYALQGKGKRIRPRLLYSVLEGYHIDKNIGNDFACALEMIHTYSLIHDDLPAMDDDTLRRGRATCHIAFDEAPAILAGDALLTKAFEITSKNPINNSIKAINMLASCAGINGMIYGQTLDIEAESLKLDYEQIKKIHNHKTGCLLACPLAMAAIIALKNDETVNKWYNIGIKLGLAFQIQDDILDLISDSETLGKSNSDIENNKQTICTILGIDEAKKLMLDLYEECENEILSFKDFDAKYIFEIIDSLKVRKF